MKDDRERIPFGHPVPGTKDVPPEFPILDISKRINRERHYTPFIVLQSQNQAFPLWLSPNLWLTDAFGNVVISPVEGEPYNVWALVSNFGMAGAVVNVKFWWADPSVAITEAAATEIGTATAFVDGSISLLGNAKPVRCTTTWTPAFLNQGHECLMAKAWAPGFDPSSGQPGFPEPPFDIYDRHSAQRNLGVLKAAPGTQAKWNITVANISRMALPALVEVRTLAFEEMAKGLRALFHGTRLEVVKGENNLELGFTLQERGTFRYIADRTFTHMLSRADRVALATERKEEPRGRVIFRQVLEMKPFEHRMLVVEGRIPTGAKPGQMFGFDIRQQLEDVETGGYTIYVLATEGRG